MLKDFQKFEPFLRHLIKKQKNKESLYMCGGDKRHVPRQVIA